MKKVRDRKMWRYLLYLLLILLGILVYSFFDDFVKDQRYQASELVKFSDVRICTYNQQSVETINDPSGTLIYVVPENVETIYVCGTIATSRRVWLIMYIYKGTAEKAFDLRTQAEPMQGGSFIVDLISSSSLDPGEYRVGLYNARYNLASLKFKIEK